MDMTMTNGMGMNFEMMANVMAGIKLSCEKEMRKRTADEEKFVRDANNILYENMKGALSSLSDADEINSCIAVMFEAFPSYTGAQSLEDFFLPMFKKEVKKEREAKMVEDILSKKPEDISNEEYAILAKQLASVKAVCEKEGRKRTADEERLFQNVNEKVYLKLEKYIYNFVHRNYPYTEGKFDDLVNTCIVTLFEHFPEYNNSCDLTVFFARWFKGECNLEIAKDSGRTRYYNNKANVINRAIKALEAAGLSTEEISVTDIQMQLEHDGIKNISAQVIKNTLATDIKIEPLMPNDEYVEENEFGNPESRYLKEEQQNEINSILSALNPAERIAFLLNVGYYNDETGFVPLKSLTAKQISMYPVFLQAVSNCPEYKKNISCKKSKFYDALDEELKEYFTDKVCVSADFVTAVIAKARRIVKNHPAVIEKYDKAATKYGISATSDNALKNALSLEDILENM